MWVRIIQSLHLEFNSIRVKQLLILKIQCRAFGPLKETTAMVNWKDRQKPQSICCELKKGSLFVKRANSNVMLNCMSICLEIN